MEFKGTKGKWKANGYDVLIDDSKRDITLEYSCGGFWIERDYNALLISKAPELLGMLRVILELSEGNLKLGTDITLEEYYTEFEEARELIKQATTLQND